MSQPIAKMKTRTTSNSTTSRPPPTDWHSLHAKYVLTRLFLQLYESGQLLDEDSEDVTLRVSFANKTVRSFAHVVRRK